MSAHRRYYGVRAAQSEQDLSDERVLFGPPAHAPRSSARILSCSASRPIRHTTFTATTSTSDSDTGTIARRPGRTQVRPGPARSQSGRHERHRMGNADAGDRRQHRPSLREHEGQERRLQPVHAAPASRRWPSSPARRWRRITASVGNDESLGADVTALDPQPGAPADLAYTGKMWARQDGTAFVDSSGAAAAVSSGSVHDDAASRTRGST